MDTELDEPLHAPYLAPLVRGWAESLRPRSVPPPWDWAEQNIVLPAECYAIPGPFHLARAPYLRGVLEAVVDPDVEEIVLMWGTQLGKTLLLQLILAWLAAAQPAPALLATPDKPSLQKLRTKFYDVLDASPATAALAPPRRFRNNFYVDFPASRCYLGYAGNSQTLSGESCRYVLCTELDRWRDHAKQGASHDKARQRVKAFHRHKVIFESTPTDETSAIADLFDAADDRRYFCWPCPTCGHWQEFRFFRHADGAFAGRGGVAGLQDEAGNWLSSSAALAAAYYQCEAGGCRIEQHQKPGLVAAGRWVSSVDPRTGEAPRSKRRVGFQLGSLAGEPISFGSIAAEYLENRDKPSRLHVFFNDWLGLRYYHSKRVPRWEKVARRLAGNHRRGTVPAQAFFLTCGADTQDDSIYFVVRGWGEGGTSWLVDFGKIMLPEGIDGGTLPAADVELLVRNVLDQEYRLVQPNAAGKDRLKVYRAGIDEQGHRTREIRAWFYQRKGELGPRLRLIAGDYRVAAGSLYQKQLVDVSPATGKPKIVGGLERWIIDVDAYKEALVGKFSVDLSQPGAWWLYEGIIDDGSVYLRQLCNEAKRPKKTASGRDKLQWSVLDKAVGNHYWDCEIYAWAIADMAVDQDWKNLARRAAPPAVHRAPPADPGAFGTPDGRPFLITERDRG